MIFNLYRTMSGDSVPRHLLLKEHSPCITRHRKNQFLQKEVKVYLFCYIGNTAAYRSRRNARHYRMGTPPRQQQPPYHALYNLPAFYRAVAHISTAHSLLKQQRSALAQLYHRQRRNLLLFNILAYVCSGIFRC